MGLGTEGREGGTRDLQGMSVEALDGSAGKVDGVIEREGTRYLLVDTGPWIFGKTVMLPLTVVEGVDAEREVVAVRLTKAQIKDAPEPVVQASEPPPELELAPEPAQQEAPGALVAASTVEEQPDAGPADDVPAAGNEVEQRYDASPPAWPTPVPARVKPEDLEPSPKADIERRARKRRPPQRARGNPIARYDSLTAAEVIPRLRGLTRRELVQVERHERNNQNRQTVLARIESLREDPPWRGYDEQTVREITKKLSGRDPDKVRAVRDYERRHRDRTGIVEAARRILEKA